MNVRTVGFASLAVFAALAVSRTPGDQLHEELRAAIQAQDRNAAREAMARIGNHGDEAIAAALRTLLKPPLREQLDLVPEAEIALAKLGDRETLQGFACRVQSDHPLVKQDAIQHYLPSIGGWFSIRLLIEQFDADQQWEARKDMRDFAPDVILNPPSTLALQVLPRLVRDAPIEPPTALEAQMRSAKNAEKIAAWRDWIGANRDKLAGLEPTGSGVDYSGKTCNARKYRSKAKEWRKRTTGRY